MIKFTGLLLIVLTTGALLLSAVNSPAQKASKADIDLWRKVLHNVRRELKSNYYDPTFHGMDIDSRFEQAEAKMKNAQSLGQLVGIVAHVGVTPDELILPTPEEMSQRLDPVMARAAALAGFDLDPKKAGQLFPIEWKTR